MFKKRTTKKQESKKRSFLFIKTFFITITIILCVVFSGLSLARSWIKAPEIPEDVATTVTVNDYAYLPASGEKEDMLIGDGLRAPEGFSSSDRKDEFYTFLIFGLDEGVNTDTIMIASYDGIDKEASIIGIPRDSLVNVKRKTKKINAAYPAGTLYGGGKEGGIEQLKRELKTIIGFVPDFYVCIDLDAFKKIVDAVNGIDVDIPFDMSYDDDFQDLHINFKKGLQHLDGKNALKFARFRKGNNIRSTITDYQRIENQQAVIKAVLTKLLKPENLLKIPKFVDIFNENVFSDIKLENMLWFAEQLNNIRGTDALSFYTIPTTDTSGPPMYYEYLDKAGIIELINKTVNPYKKDIEEKDLDILTNTDL